MVPKHKLQTNKIKIRNISDQHLRVSPPTITNSFGKVGTVRHPSDDCDSSARSAPEFHSRIATAKVEVGGIPQPNNYLLHRYNNSGGVTGILGWGGSRFKNDSAVIKVHSGDLAIPTGFHGHCLFKLQFFWGY